MGDSTYSQTSGMGFPLSMGAAKLPVTMGTGGLEEAEAGGYFLEANS